MISKGNSSKYVKTVLNFISSRHHAPLIIIFCLLYISFILTFDPFRHCGNYKYSHMISLKGMNHDNDEVITVTTEKYKKQTKCETNTIITQDEEFISNKDKNASMNIRQTATRSNENRNNRSSSSKATNQQHDYILFTPKKFPCFADRGPKSSPAKGFFYRKIHKAASSTLAGVAMRIAQRQSSVVTAVPPTNDRHRHAITTKNNVLSSCYVQAKHETSSEANSYLSSRDRDHSFLWTFLRDPKQRMISYYFFFKVSLSNHTPTGRDMIHYFSRKRNVQSRYIAGSDITPIEGLGGGNVTEMSLSIARQYDFIGVTERLDESLVALRLLLNLTANEILYTTSKQSGSFVVSNHTNDCQYIISSFTTPLSEHYLETEWKTNNALDYALYAVAERSLEETIERVIGRDRFEEALEGHYELLERVKERCAGLIKYPCSVEGTLQESDCFWHDIGCGHTCLDSL